MLTVSGLRGELHAKVAIWEEIEMGDLQKVNTAERMKTMQEKTRSLIGLVCESYSGDFQPMYQMIQEFEKRALEWVDSEVLLWEHSEAHKIETKIRETVGLSAL